jgi:uncharacterized peroxidase-related enzyme
MFLGLPPPNDSNSAHYSRDIADDGYVSNLTRLWSWRPDIFEAFNNLRNLLTEQAALSLRERAILVCATAANLGDSYCALAWGKTLATTCSPTAAAEVLKCKEPEELTAREKALTTWAGQVVHRPNSITAEDVDHLRRVGLTDQEIFDVTAFVAFRVAFSTVNDALGAQPDRQLAAAAPSAVRESVVYGRRISDHVSQ